jgi:transcriptional regulator with XRE-family HTH domain
MTAQFPTFRLTVARQMAGHRQRLAERIDQELQKRGEDHTDLAHALRVNPRTAERWVTGETEPHRRLRKPVADYLDLSIEELWPDLEAADKALRDQLTRIEAKLDELLGSERARRVERAVADAALATQSTRDGSSTAPRAKAKR